MLLQANRVHSFAQTKSKKLSSCFRFCATERLHFPFIHRRCIAMDSMEKVTSVSSSHHIPQNRYTVSKSLKSSLEYQTLGQIRFVMAIKYCVFKRRVVSDMCINLLNRFWSCSEILKAIVFVSRFGYDTDVFRIDYSVSYVVFNCGVHFM